MKRRNIIFVILGMILIITFALGLVYYFRDRRTYTLDLPEIEECNKITIEKNEKYIEISDINEMKEIKDILYGIKRISENESVQDSPVNVKDEIKVNFYFNEGNSSTVFVYKKNFKYYMEQPYNGIYPISEDEYNSIEKLLSISI